MGLRCHFAITALLRRGRLSTACVVAMAVSIGWLAAGVVAVAAPVESLRVMTFNILGGTGGGQPIARTIDVVNAVHPDVIGIQEASSYADDIAAALGFH
jgi:hypothetical protein